MSFDQIIGVLINELGEEVILAKDEIASPNAILIEPKMLQKLMQTLHEHESLYFDSLSCITSLDQGVESDSLEIAYNLYSIPFDHHLMVKVKILKSNPKISSVTQIWKTADWHEREAYDLMGIQFEGHPDLRRILMPADWEGHPLRKDYQEQIYYRGVKVKY